MVLVEEALTYSVIGAFFTTYNKLGHGFVENVYVGALVIEIQRRGHHVAREVPIAVRYEGSIIGSYRVDLLVDRKLIVEVKADVAVKSVHEKQLRNYLRCTDLELGLLLVFGERPFHRRVIHSNQFKKFEIDPRSFPHPPQASVEAADP